MCTEVKGLSESRLIGCLVNRDSAEEIESEVGSRSMKSPSKGSPAAVVACFRTFGGADEVLSADVVARTGESGPDAVERPGPSYVL